MKIAIIGYGKMGKAIDAIATERGHSIPLKITSTNLQDLNATTLQDIDVAIEFSRPEFAIENIENCLNNSTPIVVGTTGWYKDFERIQSLCKEKNTALLAATNFSVGVNLFFELNKTLARLMNPRKEYKATIEEIHHTEKLDSPSGTAITLAEGIIEQHNAYSSWQEGSVEKEEILPIEALREPEVPGTHEITYESEIDIISIKHLAKNRKGFALGAVLAAEYIHNKKGVFNMQDVLNL